MRSKRKKVENWVKMSAKMSLIWQLGNHEAGGNKPKLKRLNSKPIDYEVGTIGQNGCNYGLNLKNEKPRS